MHAAQGQIMVVTGSSKVPNSLSSPVPLNPPLPLSPLLSRSSHQQMGKCGVTFLMRPGEEARSANQAAQSTGQLVICLRYPAGCPIAPVPGPPQVSPIPPLRPRDDVGDQGLIFHSTKSKGISILLSGLPNWCTHPRRVGALPIQSGTGSPLPLSRLRSHC
ncbi:uncharacterized protein N7458_011379 [Penicillium daleae]|uniref:Uncharacterized protein n=1 Tax=Penicillium daleae TaxID=63821 RepID=A0AAD6FVZ5_9EURO|nr:uncharacterized protein N7458_011379 [Penicillium daleae]KAJ5432223.1 hypothetical protein N7458_011379 [Penicillium daleae]